MKLDTSRNFVSITTFLLPSGQPGRTRTLFRNACSRRWRKSAPYQSQRRSGCNLSVRPVPLRRGPALRSGRLDRRAPAVAGLVAQLLLDPDQLIVLRQAIRAGERTGLDLSAIGRDREVRDGRILGLPRTVRHDRGVARPMRHIDGGQRLAESADLVHFDEDRI